jgi:hypothetical protein
MAAINIEMDVRQYRPDHDELCLCCGCGGDDCIEWDGKECVTTEGVWIPKSEFAAIMKAASDDFIEQQGENDSLGFPAHQPDYWTFIAEYISAAAITPRR